MRTMFHNGLLFDGVNDPRPGMTVIVEANKITAVREGAPPETGEADQVIDLDGALLMPGMTLGHWHSDYPNLKLGQPELAYLGQERPPAYHAALSMKNLQIALSSGFIAVVGAGCSNDIDASMKMAIAEGVFDGPRITCAGKHVNPTGGDNDRAKWWLNLRPAYQNGVSAIGQELFCDGVDAMRWAVRDQISRGVEVIKTFPTSGHGIEVRPDRRELTREEMRTIIETAHDRGALVRGHVASAAAILECIELGMDIVDHGDGMDERCIEAMVKHGTILVPSMLFLNRLMAFPAGMLPPSIEASVRKDFEHMVGILPAAHAAGVTIVPGDDYGLDFMRHEPGIYALDLAIHVEHCGIPAGDVLKWATANGAKMRRCADSQGEIKAGYVADILVVEGNPTQDIGILSRPLETIKFIMLNGKVIKNETASKSAAPSSGQSTKKAFAVA